jgi:hypothetical protein
MRLCTMGVWQVGSSTKCQCFRTMTRPRWWNAVTRNRPDTEPQERDSLIDLQNTPFFGKLGDWMGVAPKYLAPNLYKITHFKSRSVHAELKNHSWIKNLQAIDSTHLLVEFTLLFISLVSVELIEQKDEITWIWTADGIYSIASVYEC